MNKILGLVIILLIMAANVCLASPLTDYAFGKVSLGVNFGVPSLTADNWHTKTKLNVDYHVTAGLGFGYAVQYIYNDFKPKTYIDGVDQLKAQQVNLLTNELKVLGGNISAFVGGSKTQIVGDTAKNGIVAGLIGSVPIAPNTHAYATVSTGHYLDGYEVGIGYNLTRNMEVNLNYRNTNYKGLAPGDILEKGSYGGVVYKF